MMRKLHRWLMTVFSVLLFYWVGSGLLLAIYDLTDATSTYAREGGGVGAPMPENIFGLRLAGAAALSEDDVADMVTAAVAAAGREAPGEALESLELHATADAHVATIRLKGAQRHTLMIDTGSGQRLASVPATGPGQSAGGALHAPIKRWHRGLMFGTTGAVLSFASGLALVILCLTGIALYLDLWLRRRRNGRPAFFWS